MNQLVCVSHPLYFLLSLSFCYGFFKLYVCLSYLLDRSWGWLQESISLTDTIPASGICLVGKRT